MKINCIFIVFPFVKIPFPVYFYQAKRNTPAIVGKKSASFWQVHLLMSVHEMDIESPAAPHLDTNDTGQQIIAGIRTALLARKSMATNKDIILELLVRLETEKDMAKLEIYRSALERVVHATPDDI